MVKTAQQFKEETEAEGELITARGAWEETANKLVERSNYVFLTKEELLLAIYCHLQERGEIRGIGGMSDHYYSWSEKALYAEFKRFFL